MTPFKADILRTFGKISPEALADMSVHLVEVSDVMRRLQETALCPGEASEHRLRDVSGNSNAIHRRETKVGPPVSWYSSARDVPKGFSFYVAHEFFDALPVHKFVRGGDDDQGIVQQSRLPPQCVQFSVAITVDHLDLHFNFQNTFQKGPLYQILNTETQIEIRSKTVEHSPEVARDPR